MATSSSHLFSWQNELNLFPVSANIPPRVVVFTRKSSPRPSCGTEHAVERSSTS